MHRESLESSESSPESIQGPRTRILLAILAAIIIAAFFNSLSGKFVYDDVQQIDTNQLLGHWDRATIGRLLTHDIKATLRQDLPGGHPYSYYYRPLFMIYLMLAYEVAGHHAFWWHCLALVLHLLASALAFLLLRKILLQTEISGEGSRDNIAFIAALVFAIHPVQCESVSWISGSVNAIAAVLCFSSFYCYLTYKESTARTGGATSSRASTMLAAAGILYGLALPVKESALFLPLLIAGHEFLVFKKGARAWAPRLISAAPFAVVTAAYLVIRLRVLGVVTGGEGFGASGPDLIQTARGVLTVPGLMARYSRLIIFPFGLSVNYDFNRVNNLTILAFWAPLAYLVAISLLMWLLWTKSTVARIGVLWLVAPLLPHLNPGFFSPEEMIHDRYLYLSMLGAGILVSLLFIRARHLSAPGLKRHVPILASGIVILLSILTASQNKVWRDNRTLWSNAVRTAPNARIAHYWLGTLAESDQDLDEAGRQYSYAVRIDPGCIDCLNNLAFVYAHQGRWEDSIEAFERVISLTPDHSTAHFNLSFAYAVVRRYRDAIREQRLAIELEPSGPRAEEWRARERQLEALGEG